MEASNLPEGGLETFILAKMRRRSTLRVAPLLALVLDAAAAADVVDAAAVIDEAAAATAVVVARSPADEGCVAEAVVEWSRIVF